MKQYQISKQDKQSLYSIGLKRCANAGCQQELPLDYFGKKASEADGLRTICKACSTKQGASWYHANKQHARKKNLEWQRNNREVVRRRNNEWGKKNRPSKNAIERKRRATKLEINENFTLEDEAFCMERANHKCQNCGMSNTEHKERYKTRLHLDHIKPLSKGNPLTRENCQVLCKTCNSTKGTK